MGRAAGKTCGVYGRATLAASSAEEAAREVGVWAEEVAHLAPQNGILTAHIFAVAVGRPPRCAPIVGRDGRFTVPLTGQITVAEGGSVSPEHKSVWDGLTQDLAANHGIRLDLWWVAR